MESDSESLQGIFQLAILLDAMPLSGILSLILGILLLLLGSALISGSEVAYFSLTHNDLAELEQNGRKSSLRVIKLINRPRRLLATILISNNFINVAIVILTEYLSRQFWPDGTFASAGRQLSTWFPAVEVDIWTGLVRGTVTVLGVTFLLVLLGEVAPKVYARLNKMLLAKFMSLPLDFLRRFFSPVSELLVNMTNLVEKRLARNNPFGGTTTKEDLDEAIELTVSQANTQTIHEADILKRILKFGDVSAKQIMRSRVDVVAIDEESPYPEVMEVVRESGFSRIPVYTNDLDNITGILYVKDLLGHLNEPAEFDWKGLVRENVLYVPETKKIDDLLREFQVKHMHMGIVVDEYGGSAGIITLEDIMEEVIGEIKDEFDDEREVEYRKIDDRNYLFEGKTLLHDLCRVLELDTATFDEFRGDADSIAGLLLEVLGHLPRKDVEVQVGQFLFKVMSVSNRRIEQVLVTLQR